MPGFSNVGAISPINVGAEQLGQLGSALGQFPQAQMEAETQQMILKSQKAKALQELLKSMAGQIQQNPADPKMIKQVQRLYREAGMDPSGLTTPAKGPGETTTAASVPGVAAQAGTAGTPGKPGEAQAGAAALPAMNTMVPERTPAQPEMLNPQAIGIQAPKKYSAEAPYEEFQHIASLAPGQIRNAYIDSHYVDAPESWYTMPQVMDEKAKLEFEKEAYGAFNKTATGVWSPDEYMKFVRDNADSYVQINKKPSDLLQDPQLMLMMGQTTDSQIQRWKKYGLLQNANIDLAYTRINTAKSMDDYNQARAALGWKRAAVVDEQAQAQVTNANAHATQAGAYAAKVAQDIQDSLHGKWSDIQRVRSTNSRQIADALKAANTDRTNLLRIAGNAQNNYTDPNVTVQDSTGQSLSLGDVLDQTEATIKALKSAQSDLSGAKPSATQTKNTLHTLGVHAKVPGSFTPPSNWQSFSNGKYYKDPQGGWHNHDGTPYVGQSGAGQ